MEESIHSSRAAPERTHLANEAITVTAAVKSNEFDGAKLPIFETVAIHAQ